MKNTCHNWRIAVALCVLGCAAFAAAQNANSDWKAVEQAMGRSGQDQPGGVHKFGMPRSDLHVSVNGVAVKAGLALGSWAAFDKPGSGSMVMGDLVLTPSEVEPVMAKLQEGGIEVTALHNHLLWESPRVMYMHIRGHGDAVKLAQAIHAALALTKTPASAPKPAAAAQFELDQKQIEAALGHAGKVNGGILQVAVPRAEKITDASMAVPPSMGVASSINFQPTGSGRAATTGDFVLIASEVNPVIHVLRANGIAVTALHSHMLDEQPRLFFMHFWADGDAVKLAHGLGAALEKTNSGK
jgi:uncharacterized protein DUF1259